MKKTSQTRKTALEIAIDNTLDYLRRRNYHPITVNHHRYRYNDLIRFAREKRLPRLTKSVLSKYEECRMKTFSPSHQKKLNHSLRVLWECHQTGSHRLIKPKSAVSLPPCFERDLENLLIHCHEELGWSQKYRDDSCYRWRHFMHFACQRRRLKKWDSLRPDDFSEYVRAYPNWSRRTQRHATEHLRTMSRLAFVLGKLRHPLHEQMPCRSKSGCGRNFL